MYKDKNGNSIYTLWNLSNPNIEMPEPMKRYNPDTVVANTLSVNEFSEMFMTWVKYWRDTDLPKGL